MKHPLILQRLHYSLFLVLFTAALLSSMPASGYAEKYWVFDAERDFSAKELYMMENCDPQCDQLKYIKSINNPPWVPILADKYATNDRVAEMYFPGCQYADSPNFCKKTMAQPMPQRQFPFNSEIWQAFSIFVPANHSHQTKWNLIWQYHGHPDNIDDCDYWRTPPFSIELHDNWRFIARYSKVQCNPRGKNNGVQVVRLNNRQPVLKGGWTHFVINIRFSWTESGKVRVWLTDDDHGKPLQVVGYGGPIGYNDTRSPADYLSFGYYHGDSNAPDVRLYFDRIIFGDADESLDSMMYAPGN